MKKQIGQWRDYDVYSVRRAFLNRQGNQTLEKFPHFISKNGDGKEYLVILNKYSKDFIENLTADSLARIAIF